jgi:hypothetical protein
MSLNAHGVARKVRQYPLLVVCGILVVALSALLYMRRDLSELQQVELDKHLADNRRHRINITNSAMLQDQLDYLIQANAAVRNRALTANGLAQNLQYFYRLEAEVGIKYLDLRPASRPASKSSTYVPVAYAVNVQGDFAQIIKFLRHLEQGAYFCRINSALLTGKEDLYTLNLNIDLLGVP